MNFKKDSTPNNGIATTRLNDRVTDIIFGIIEYESLSHVKAFKVLFLLSRECVASKDSS